jgi:hypothetical protein
MSKRIQATVAAAARALAMAAAVLLAPGPDAAAQKQGDVLDKVVAVVGRRRFSSPT